VGDDCAVSVCLLDLQSAEGETVMSQTATTPEARPQTTTLTQPDAVPAIQALAFRVFTSADPAHPFADTDWQPTEHMLTILRPDPNDPARDQLFVDDVHIEPTNWQWRYADSDLVWHQGIHDGYLGGHLTLYGRGGQGRMTFGAIEQAVQVQYVAAVYKCKLSSNAGATLDRSGNLSWDTTSDAWKNATWVDAMVFGYYSFPYRINHAPAIATACAFTDTRGNGSCWAPWTPPAAYQAANLFKGPCETNPADRGDAGNSTFTFRDLMLDYVLQEGVNPAADPQADGQISSVFPYRMTVQFVNQLFLQFDGAIVVNGASAAEGGVVYAVKGQALHAPHLVGSYVLRVGDGAPSALVSVHDTALVVNGQRIDNVTLDEASLRWHGLSAETAAAAGIPTEGYLAFAASGDAIVASSFGATGARVGAGMLERRHPELVERQPKLKLKLGKPLESNLNVNGLMTMNNYELVSVKQGDQTVSTYQDVIQKPTMDSFYKILQSYIDRDLREQYITKAPIDLDDREKAIAADNANNQTFYKLLQVPYVTNGLAQAQASDDQIRHLNAARARKVLTNEPAKHAEFTSQISQLYQYHWEKKFGQITAYLVDQNTIDHNADIDGVQKEWIGEIELGAESIANPNDPTGTVNQQITYINELTSNAKSKKAYWAYMLYLYLVSNEAMQAYQHAINNPPQSNKTDASQSITLLLQTNNAILNVLDPSGYFSGQYTEVLQMFNLSGVLTNWINYGGNLSNFSFAAEEILRGYLNTYVNALDPDIAKRVQELQKAFTQETIEGIRQVYIQSLSEVGVAGSWADLMEIYDHNLLSKGGSSFKILAIGFAASMNIISIVMMCSGKQSFLDLSGETQARVIIGGIDALAHVMAYAIKGGLRSYYFLDRTASYWSQTKQLFKLFNFESTVAQDSIGTIQNGFVRWLARGNEAASVEAAVALVTDAEAEELSFAQKFFGGSLDEFVAVRLGTVLAVANLILCAIQLAKDTDKYDKIVDSLFVAAAALDIIALTATWSLAFVAAETTGAALISGIASVAGPLAILASIVGIILFFVFQKEHDPVYRFLQDYAKPKNLYMDGTAIDYFALNRTKDNKVLPAGMGLLATTVSSQRHVVGGGNNVPIIYYTYTVSDQSKALTFKADGSGASNADFSHTWANVFSLSVDDQGIAQFFAVTPERSGTKSYALATKDNSLVLQDLSSKDNTEDARKWIVAIISSDSAGGDTNVPTAAIVSLQNKANNMYLKNDLTLSSAITVPPGESYNLIDFSVSPVWRLKRVYSGIANVTYEPLVVFVDPADTTNISGSLAARPFIGQGGQHPYTWTQPTGLPDFLTFDTTTGAATFKKFATTTLTPDQMNSLASKDYTVNVSSKLEDGSSVSATATLTVKVLNIKAPYQLTYRDMCLVVGKDDKATCTPGMMPFITGATWSVAPNLPSFLRLNPFSGAITQSAAPTATMPQTTYTVTVKNTLGQTSAPARITVNDAQTGCPA
jgi:hypothetical protein